MSSLPRHLRIALKQWDVICRAVLAGRQSCLLRKGGVVRARGRLMPEHMQFLFYPTFEEQSPERVRPAFADLLADPPPAADAVVEVRGFAEVVEIHAVETAAQLDRLARLTAWQGDYLRQQWQDKPHIPLHVLAVRAWRLASPVRTTVLPRYRLCKHWISLADPVELDQATPVLSDGQAEAAVAELSSIFARSAGVEGGARR